MLLSGLLFYLVRVCISLSLNFLCYFILFMCLSPGYWVIFSSLSLSLVVFGLVSLFQVIACLWLISYLLCVRVLCSCALTLGCEVHLVDVHYYKNEFT